MKKNTISTGADLQQAEPHSTEESMDQTMQNTSVGSNADVTPNDTVEGSTFLAEPVLPSSFSNTLC